MVRWLRTFTGSSQASKAPSCWPTRTPCSPATVKGLRASVCAWITGPEVSKAMGGSGLKTGVCGWENRIGIEAKKSRKQNVRRMAVLWVRAFPGLRIETWGTQVLWLGIVLKATVYGIGPMQKGHPCGRPFLRLQNRLEGDPGADLNLTGVGPIVVIVVPESRGVVDLGIGRAQLAVIENVIGTELKLQIVTLADLGVLE